MSTTAVYSVSNPVSGTEYVAPSAYWVIPNAGTTVTCTVQAFDANGNLKQVANLFAINWDQTTSVNKSSFSGNFNTVNSSTSSTNGSDVFAPAGKVTASGVARIAMYLTYTGSAFDNPPNAPSNLAPTGGAITGLVPTFTGSFTDPDAGDTLYQYEIVVNSAANGGGSQVWDSGVLNASSTEITNAAFSKVYAGTALTAGQTYSWKARTADQKGTFGGYSAWQNFQPNTGPNAPSSVAPTGQQTTLTPAFSFVYTHPTPVNQASYHYTITAQSGGASVFDSGTIASVVASGATVSGTIPGGANLQNGQAYNFNVFSTDANGAASPTTTVAFSIAPLPQVSPVSPVSNATVNTQTPTYTWSYSDPNYTQANYRVLVQNATTSAQIWDSGTVGSAGQTATQANVANPAAAPVPTAAAGSTGLLAGTYTVAYSYVTVLGETLISPTASVVITAGQQINVASVTLPLNVVSINWYLSIAAGSSTLGISKNNNGTATALTVIGNGTRPPVSNTSALIAFGTTIRWQVTVTDTAGLSSGFSAYGYALVQNTPSAAITSPVNNSTITNNSPTVQWTYTASAGGQPQASAQVLLFDANSNLLQTFSLGGAGTLLTIPAGILINNFTYKFQVKVTDTVASVGQSSLITFTLQYTPPADIQGQPLANGKNYVLGPYMNSDVNADGVADNFTSFATGGLTAAFILDSVIPQPQQNPNGDGPFTGAQKLVLSAGASGAGQIVEVFQDIIVATAGFTPNGTHVSSFVYAWVSVLTGTPFVRITLEFYNNTTLLSAVDGGAQGDTAGVWVQLLGPQNQLIPTNTTKVRIHLKLVTGAAGDTATVWFSEPQLEAAAASDANFIGGSNGTGFSFDTNNYSVRSNLAGNLPTIVANPGSSDDPVNATGGTITLNWDTTLADATRFQYYLLERRRQDQSTDDTKWVTLATITNKAVGSFTDYTPGGDTSYQYSVRQVITFTDGSIGISAHRALASGSVHYAPAWYLTNSAGTIYNLRLNTTGPKRKLTWKERAQYSDFLGRVGTARDAGPDAGYDLSLVAYFDEIFGDDHTAIRRLLVQMQQLNVVWYIRSPKGLVVPVHLDGWDLDDEDMESDTLTALTLDLIQAKDTTDY